MKIKEKIPEALLVFVTPPTVEELESPSHRQRNRNRTGDRRQTTRAGEEARYGTI